MTDKMKLLDELMDNAMQTPKFRKYNEAYQKIDSEMTRILTDEEEFDTNILKLKQEIDKNFKSIIIRRSKQTKHKYDICHIKKGHL